MESRAFYRVSEVAERLALGKSLTYRLVAEGKIPSVYVAGTRSRRVPADALARWIERESGGQPHPTGLEREGEAS